MTDSKCISDTQSKAYMAAMRKKGINVTEFPEYIPVHSVLSERTIDKYAEKLSEALKKNSHKGFPIFLSVGLSKGFGNHSVSLTLDEVQNKLILEFFDSMGKLDGEVWNEDKRMQKILQKVPKYIKTWAERTPRLIEVMKGKESVNMVGSGHCDAITLYYISKRSANPRTTTTTKIEGLRTNAKRQITDINKRIRKKETL